MSDPGHDSTNTPTPHNSPYTQSVELPDSDRHVVDGMPITIQLTVLLDDNVIRNWLVAYNLYVLQYGKSDVFRNTIISDWQQRYPTLAPHLTHTQLGKVFLALTVLTCANLRLPDPDCRVQTPCLT